VLAAEHQHDALVHADQRQRRKNGSDGGGVRLNMSSGCVISCNISLRWLRAIDNLLPFKNAYFPIYHDVTEH